MSLALMEPQQSFDFIESECEALQLPLEENPEYVEVVTFFLCSSVNSQEAENWK